MKISQFLLEAQLIEARQHARMLLAESITDYLAMTLMKLKKYSHTEVFKDKQNGIDLDGLASIVAGIKVLANQDYRETMTKDDVGINPNSSEELLKLLDSIPKDNRATPALVKQVFDSLRVMAPSLFKKVRSDLESLKSSDKVEREKAHAELVSFARKVNELFHKVKAGVDAKNAKKELA